MSEYVDFHYMPLDGRITGEQVLKQTEDAINDLGNKVYSLDIDQSEIDEAIEKSNEAINTANSALSAVTTGRSVWFNNVAEMVATDIEAGVTAETKGYYVANDGGNGLYLIRQEKSGDVVDGGSLIALDNGNMAELVTDGTVNVKQFGAIGNGTDDDTTVFQNTSSYAQTKGFVPFVGVATYKITSNITGTFNSFGEVTITGGGSVDIINLQEVVSDVSDIRDEVVDETASAKAYSESAATSATNASNSASSASTTATQLMEYLETKETLTAPAVDPTLTISGAAADAEIAGRHIRGIYNGKENIFISENPGYIDSNGDIVSPTASKEVYTQKIPVLPGDVFDVSLQYSIARNMRLSIARYDNTETFVQKIDVISGTEASYSGKYIVPAGTYYIIFTYRTFDDATFALENDLGIAPKTAEKISELQTNAKLDYDGRQTFLFYGQFENFVLDGSGNILPTQRYRVSNVDIITLTSPVEVTIADGFRFGYRTYIDGSFVSDSGWLTGKHTIPSGSYRMQIARVTEDISEFANVNEFTSAVTFETVLSQRVDSVASETSALTNSAIGNDDIAGTWISGVVTSTYDGPQSKTIKTAYIDVSSFRSVTFSCDSGYKFDCLSYDADKTFLARIPYTSDSTVLEVVGTNIKYIRVNMRNGAETDIDISYGVHMHINGSNRITDVPKLSKRINVVENPFRNLRFLNHIGVGKSSNVKIPCQSIADVLRTKRLGFSVLEVNVHKTNDNKYVCLHGNSGKFGGAFIGADDSDVSNIAVSSVTLAWIQANVRFVSDYPKYQTAPPTLEEMLTECQKLGVIPLVQYVDADMVAILNKVMGLDNYILNLYSADRNGITDALCMSWTAIADADTAVAKCKANGTNYILGVDWSNSAFSAFTASDWIAYVRKVHEAGYFLATAYCENHVNEFLGYGFDSIASGGSINDIESGNICNLDAGVEFTDYQTNGTVSNGTLMLSEWQTVEPSQNLDSVFLGGGVLHIRFNGQINVHIGIHNLNIESDGSNYMYFSSVFEEEVPTFSITALGNVEMYDIIYKASKM